MSHEELAASASAPRAPWRHRQALQSPLVCAAPGKPFCGHHRPMAILELLQDELVSEALADCKKYGMRNIVALRGDPPRGQR